MNMQTNNKETKTRTELTYKRGLNGEQVSVIEFKTKLVNTVLNRLEIMLIVKIDAGLRYVEVGQHSSIWVAIYIFAVTGILAK